MAQNTITITDHSLENSTFGYQSAVLTAGNIVAQTALHATLAAATEDLTIGHLAKQSLAQIFVDDPGGSSDPYAQRELKWLVTYQSVTSGKKWSLEIPAPALTDNLVPNTDVADITSADWAAWITAFVAVAKAPDDIADAVIVLGARLVGRNI